MEIDFISPIRNACNAALAKHGPNANMVFSVDKISAIVKSVEEQEREIVELERELSGLKSKTLAFLETLSCNSFEHVVPAKELDGDLFEVFVGEISDCGRIFAFWDDSEQSFYDPEEEGQDRVYRDDAVYWRYLLPDPHEAFDLEEHL